jgi:glycosyltransferase involved in cell wall biosynthesis
MENKEYKTALFMLPLLTQGGGAEKYFIDLARNLQERNFPTDIVTMDENFFRRFARALHILANGNFFSHIDIEGREKEADIRQRLGEAAWKKSNRKDLSAILNAYDVIYSKNEIVDLFLLKLIGYKNLPPIVVGVHTPLFYPNVKTWSAKFHNFLYSSFLYRWLLKGTKAIHVSNKFTAELVRKNFRVEAELIYYPFSVENIAHAAQIKSTPISFEQDKFNIIYSGRLGEQKGTDILLDIIRWLDANKELRKKIQINIFGKGEEKYSREIEKAAGQYPYIRYFGHLEHRHMPSVLARQDIMIAPYRWETLPFVILEAQALGVPVIAFDIPGPADIIEEPQTGFLAVNEKEFKEKISQAIENNVRFEKNIIRQSIKNKFDPDKIYFQMINLFIRYASK